MAAINPAQAALTRWMHPSVAKSWLAQITRYPLDPRTAQWRCEGAAEFRMLLTRDWVALDMRSVGGSLRSH